MLTRLKNGNDLTRSEAIEWCRDHVISFKSPVFPPPCGWAWAEAGPDGQHTLEPIFTNSTERRITHADAFDFE